MPNRFLTTSKELDVEQAITAMVAYPTLEQAVEYLKQAGYTTTTEKLRNIRDVWAKEKYQQRREEMAPALERAWSLDMMDGARYADMVSTFAVQKAMDMLAAGKVADPARFARDIQQVAQQKQQGMLNAQGRPTQVIEHRSFEEIGRALEQYGVLVRVEQGEIADAELVPDDKP